MQITPDSVQHIHNEQTLLAFLRETLDWRISDDADTLRDATYAWSHDDLQLDETRANIQFRQLKPFVPNQWAGIFIVKFPDNTTAYKTALRKALRGLVTKKRGGSTSKTWALENLFFICTPNYKDFTFAHYSGETPYKAKLATFSWEYQSPYLRTLCDYNLPNLALPDSLETDAWRNQWLSAFDVEKVTEKFFQDFEAAFQTLFANGFGTSDKENRIAALTTLNRLMFLYFIQKKNWLNDDGDYLAKKLAEAKKKSLNFYSDILKRIYFEFLSVPLHERNKRHFGQSAREIHSLIGRIPFLNGGLFEKKSFDERIAFTNEAFERIFGFFQRYHFTVAENTPLDVEVAVDPEMLGKVFESLIGEERKQKGMFYTPASVVSFMCKESLLQYLRTTLPSDAQALETFVRNLDASRLKQPEAVLDALSTVKILDPACGSGAFLLGMLHELLSLRYALFAAKHIDQKTIYERKKDIIEQTLYGIDIDPFAVEMAQFRLWLSLAVDFQHNLIDEIPALPNLDFKIRTGDSLVAEYEGVSFHYDPNRAKGKKSRIESALKTIVALQHDYFNAHTANDKHTLKSKLHRELRNLTITELDLRIKEISIQETLLGETAKEKKIREAQEADIAKLQRLIADLNTRDTLPDNFPLLWEVDFANVINEGGFDIVIGNPPYIRQETLGNAYKAELKKAYPNVFTGTADLLVNFFELAHQRLRPNGTLALITSNKWLRAGYGNALRDFLKTETTLDVMIDFGDLPVFKQAIAYPMILIAQKHTPKPDAHFRALEVESLDVLERLGETVATDAQAQPQADLDAKAWRIESPLVARLMQKLKQNSIPLGEFVQGKFYRGITTGFNEAFVIDAETRASLIAEDPKSAEIIKPFLRGRDIKRYEINNPNLYVIYVPWDFDTKKFPAVFEHLKKFKKDLSKRPEVKQGRFSWYAMSRYAADYWEEFEKPKIVIPRIQLFASFCYDAGGHFMLDSSYICPTENLFLLGFINSNVFWFILKQSCNSIQNNYLNIQIATISKLPIPCVSEAQEAAIAKRVEQILAKKQRGEDTTRLEREIDELVYGLYGLTAEEIAVVEGQA